jgi:hypothetical protein
MIRNIRTAPAGSQSLNESWGFFMPKSVERACNAKKMVTQDCLMEPD